MSFVIAIPTYGRHHSLRVKTYALLRRHNLLHKTTLFVVAQEEAIYRESYPELSIVVGKKGLIEQREVIFNYYPEGTNILQLDDDVETVIDHTRTEVEDLEQVILQGFALAEQEGARLWGIYPIDNPFFFTKDSTTLKFIVGAFFGLVKRRGDSCPPLKEPNKEDYYRTCWCFAQDGKVVRLNSYGVRTKYFKNPGGLSETRTLENNAAGAEIVRQDFPEWVTLYIRKGRTEIRLKKKLSSS